MENSRFKFRAKRKDNGELVYGNFATLPCGISESGCTDEFGDFGDFIIVTKTKQSSYYSNSNPMEVCYCEYYLIDFETIQQSTGLKDKNGKLIFEGDVVRVDDNLYVDGVPEGYENKYAIINYREEQAKWYFEFMPKNNSGEHICELVCDFWHFVDINTKPNTLEYIEVIGNIYENSDLIETEG